MPHHVQVAVRAEGDVERGGQAAAAVVRHGEAGVLQPGNGTVTDHVRAGIDAAARPDPDTVDRLDVEDIDGHAAAGRIEEEHLRHQCARHADIEAGRAEDVRWQQQAKPDEGCGKHPECHGVPLVSDPLNRPARSS
jgi:hypothetical protein